MYIYESHMGYFYTSNEHLSSKRRHCNSCGDYDFLIGEANTKREAWELLGPWSEGFVESVCLDCENLKNPEHCKSLCFEFKYTGGYDRLYIAEFIEENFNHQED